MGVGGAQWFGEDDETVILDYVTNDATENPQEKPSDHSYYVQKDTNVKKKTLETDTKIGGNPLAVVVKRLVPIK